MQPLIFVSIILLITVQVISLLNSMSVHRTNYLVHERTVKHLNQEIDVYKRRTESAEEFVNRLLSEKFSQTAFALTIEGIKALPIGWEKGPAPKKPVKKKALDG